MPTKNTKSSSNKSSSLPKLGKYPVEWDMKGLYYKSLNDPQIERDVAATIAAYKKFVKLFKKSAFTRDEKVLRRAFDYLNKLSLNQRHGKATRYLGLLTALNTNNEEASSKLNLISQRLTRAGNETLFFTLELGKVSKKQQKVFLNSKHLAPFRYELLQLFDTAKYQLKEDQEALLNQLGICSYDLWVEMTEKMLGGRSVTYKGKEMPVNSAFEHLQTLPLKEQPVFWSLLMREIGELKEAVESELTAVCTKKKITDDLRGYKKPYSAAVIGHEDDEKSVEALIHAVSTEGFELSKRFYKVKAKLHGVKKLSYAQRTASLGKKMNISFAEGTELCRDVFYKVNPTYGEIFDRLLSNGQIDVYPQKGKRGGAFCWGDVAQPTNVFLNQADTLGSVETYAHEMGHAIHTERSKLQLPHYQGYSTTTAETASTFFEGLLFDHIIESAPVKQKLYLLHEKISRNIATIQRQIAFHNFELEMHNEVRNTGAITHKKLNTLMQKHLKSYCGPAIEVSELDGNSYIYIGHFRYGFYVYTYTFGILMSSLMIDALKSDSSYRDKVDIFLTAGGSASTKDIFKSIGFNTQKIETFRLGLARMKEEIKTLEKLAKKL